jgi:tetratricopeptide (TPR) repeat protein
MMSVKNRKNILFALLLCGIIASFGAESTAGSIDTEKVNFELGVSCLEQQDFRQAIKYFELIIKNNPDNVEAHYNLGLAYKKAGMEQKSVAEMDKVVKMLNNPKFRQQKVIDVTKLRNQNKILHSNELAFDQYNLYSSVKSKENDYVDLGDVHYDNQQYETAVEYYNLALQINPYNDYTYFKVAQSYAENGNYINAEPYISKAVELAPQNQKYLYFKDTISKKIGNTYIKNVNIREKILNQTLAKKDFTQGFDIPEDYRKKLFSDDEAEKKSSVEDMPEPVINEKDIQANTVLPDQKGSIKNPNKKKFKLIFGKKQDLNTEENMDFNEETAKAEKPKFKGIPLQGKSQELDYLDLGDMHYDNQEYDTAVEYYNLALNTNLNNDYTYYKLGRCYYATKQLKKADDFISKAMALSSGNKEYIYYKNKIVSEMISDQNQAIASNVPQYYKKSPVAGAGKLHPNLKMIPTDPKFEEEEPDFSEPDVSKARLPQSFYENQKANKNIFVDKKQEKQPKKPKEKIKPDKKQDAEQIASVEETTPSIFGKDMKYYQSVEPEQKVLPKDVQFDKPIAETPKQPEYTPEYYNTKGIEYYKKDNLQKAENFFKKAIELQPMYAQAYNNLANLEVKRGNLDLAITYNLQAIQINPSYPEAYYNLAMIYKKKKDFANEISYLNQTVQADPKFYQGYFTRGLAYYQAGNYEQAKYNFAETLKLKNDHYLASQNLGIIYANELNKKEAETYLKIAIKLNKKNPTSYYYLAAIYQTSGQIFEAMENYRKAIDLDPSNYKAYIALSKCYEQNDEIDRAIDTLRDATQYNTSNAEPYNMIGLLYLKKDKYIEATQSFQKAVELNSKRAIYHYNLSQSYICLNMKARARAEYEKATSITPATVQDYIDLSEIFYDRSMASYAIKTLKDGILALPENDYLYVALANFYEKTGAKESAKVTLSEYLTKKPNGTLSLLVQKRISGMGKAPQASTEDNY